MMRRETKDILLSFVMAPALVILLSMVLALGVLKIAQDHKKEVLAYNKLVASYNRVITR